MLDGDESPSVVDSSLNTVDTSEREVPEDSSTGPRTLGPDGFKHLFAMYSSSQAQIESVEDSNENESSVDLIAKEIERQVADYLGMKISFKRDINGAFIKIDQIAFWRDHAISSRFPNLVNLSLSLISIQASSAASERLFSAAGWLCHGKKNRLDKDQLAAKTFMSCNKNLLRDVIFD